MITREDEHFLDAAPPGRPYLDCPAPLADATSTARPHGSSGYPASGRRLKSAEATRGIPIIALSAHALDGERDKALAAGCDDFETKPVDLPRLLEKMQRLLGGAR